MKIFLYMWLSFILISASLCAQNVARIPGPGGKTSGGGGGFTPSFSSANGCADGETGSCTITFSVTAGQFVACGYGSSTITSNTLGISDTNLDSFSSPSGSPYTYTGNGKGALSFTIFGTTNASEVITITQSVTTTQMTAACALFSSTPTSGWDVTVAGNNNTGAPNTTLISGTSSATANASEVGIGLFLGNDGPSTGKLNTTTAGWTMAEDSVAEFFGSEEAILTYKILSTTGTQEAQVSYSTGAVDATYFGIVSTIK
jgi:hypothetical protein